jgi:ectoine hydroxylase-related dioxygenase (phytanoyl-CoA dioxygenase family)
MLAAVRPSGSLTPTELKHFREHGFVRARGVLSEADLTPMISDLCALVEKQTMLWAKEGKLPSECLDKLLALPFETRLARVVSAMREHASSSVTTATISEVQTEVDRFGLSLDTMYARTPGTFAFFFTERLLDAIQSLVGSEIVLSPIQHLRPYLPAVNGGDQPTAGAATTAPWHQDMGVTREEADGTDIVTCWIPLVDASMDMGALRVIPGLHHDQRVSKSGGGSSDGPLLEHVKDPKYGTTIRPDLIAPHEPNQVEVPCARGDILLMHHFTPHKTGGPNVDARGHVRWSLDIRFQKTGTPTGRPFWPETVVRSVWSPEAEQRDYTEWCRRWKRDLVTGQGERWHRVAGDVGGSMGGKSLAAIGSADSK